MPTAKAKTIAELEAQKKAIKDAAQAAIAAARKKAADEIAALKSRERRIRAESVRICPETREGIREVIGMSVCVA